MTVGQGWLRRWVRPRHPAEDRDQVLVVGAVVLVFVGHRPGVAPVVFDPVLRARGIVRGCFAGFQLRVQTGHHDHAVVVARRGDRILDRAVRALIKQLAVDRDERAFFFHGEVHARLGRAQYVADLFRFASRANQFFQRVGLADHAHDAGAFVFEDRRGCERSHRRHLAAGARADRAIGRRVRPVGRSLDVRRRNCRRRQRCPSRDQHRSQKPVHPHANTPLSIPRVTPETRPRHPSRQSTLQETRSANNLTNVLALVGRCFARGAGRLASMLRR